MKEEILRLIVTYFLVVIPFFIMAVKGRRYARSDFFTGRVLFGAILWFSLSSWTILGVIGHGFIAAPLPNVIAIPIWYFYSDFKGTFNVPYMALFEQAYWMLPALQFLTFYSVYAISRFIDGRLFTTDEI